MNKPGLRVIPPEVHEQFVRDAGFQYYIMNRCGVRIGRICIVTHGPDEENPFVPVDVTEQAKGYAPPDFAIFQSGKVGTFWNTLFYFTLWYVILKTRTIPRQLKTKGD